MALGTLALAGWIFVAFYLDPVGSPSDVAALVGIAFLELALAVAAAVVLVRAGSERRMLGAALGLGALFRLVMIPAGLAPERGLADLALDLRGGAIVFDEYLLYDDDVWRYLWDGRVQLSGFDPYRTTPAAIEANAERGEPAAVALLEDERWGEIHARIGYPEHPSVYPPLAQALFVCLAWAAPGSVVALKLLLVAADLGVCLLLVVLLERLGRARGWAVLYAWHPLPIKEVAGSAHLDAWLVLLLMMAVLALMSERWRAALMAWAAAIWVKLVPVALVGVVLGRAPVRRWGWAAATLGLVALPWLGSGPALLESLRSFAGSWRFNAGVWALVGWGAQSLGADDPAAWADGVCRGAVVALAIAATVWARRDRERLVPAVFWVLAATVVLAPAVMPWYVLWALPFAVAAGGWPFVVLGGLVFLSYFAYVDQQERLWWLLLEHGGFAALVMAFLALRRALPIAAGAQTSSGLALNGHATTGG